MSEKPEKPEKDEKSLSFQELIKRKKRSGFDDFSSKNKVAERREAKQAQKLKKGKSSNKKMPKEQYSKMPVSVLQYAQSEKRTSGYKLGEWQGHSELARDPRFQSSSGHLNKGLFAKSYEFVKEYQTERFASLKENLKRAKKTGDADIVTSVKDMLVEERAFAGK